MIINLVFAVSSVISAAPLINTGQIDQIISAVKTNPELITKAIESIKANPGNVQQIIDAAKSNPAVVSQVIETIKANPGKRQQIIDSIKSNPAVIAKITDGAKKNPDIVAKIGEAAQANPEIAGIIKETVDAYTSGQDTIPVPPTGAKNVSYSIISNDAPALFSNAVFFALVASLI